MLNPECLADVIVSGDGQLRGNIPRQRACLVARIVVPWSRGDDGATSAFEWEIMELGGHERRKGVVNWINILDVNSPLALRTPLMGWGGGTYRQPTEPRRIPHHGLNTQRIPPEKDVHQNCQPAIPNRHLIAT